MSAVQVLPPEITNEPKTESSFKPEPESVNVKVNEDAPKADVASNLNDVVLSVDLSPSKVSMSVTLIHNTVDSA